MYVWKPSEKLNIDFSLKPCPALPTRTRGISTAHCTQSTKCRFNSTMLGPSQIKWKKKKKKKPAGPRELQLRGTCISPSVCNKILFNHNDNNQKKKQEIVVYECWSSSNMGQAGRQAGGGLDFYYFHLLLLWSSSSWNGPPVTTRQDGGGKAAGEREGGHWLLLLLLHSVYTFWRWRGRWRRWMLGLLFLFALLCGEPTAVHFVGEKEMENGRPEPVVATA